MANYRCQTQRSNTQITAEVIQTYDLLKFALARSNGSSFLLITHYEMPFINKSEATKRSKDRKINGKCANGTNRRSRVWPVWFVYITTIARNVRCSYIRAVWVQAYPHCEQLESFHLLEYVVLQFGQAPCPLPLQVAINHHTKSHDKIHSKLQDLKATISKTTSTTTTR